MAPSTLGYALLGLLARGPRTGYQLAAQMHRSVRYFWSASHSQIYPELSRLETDGLVRHRVVEGRGPRDTKRYGLTATGRRALAAWVRDPQCEPEPTRDEFLLKVFSSWTVAPADAIALVAARRDGNVAQLAAYEALEKQFQPVPAPGTAEFAQYATLRRGLSYERHAIAWCDWLLDALRTAPADAG